MIKGVAIAQNIGINPDGSLPDGSAILDLRAEDRGLLLPRVSLDSLADVSTIDAPADGLVVYNLNPDMVGGNGVGFYFYCNEDCSIPGWKFLLFADNAPGAEGEVLVSQGPGQPPIWSSPDDTILPDEPCDLELYEACEGGVIFWLDETGEHGYVVSMVDISLSSPWSNVMGAVGTSNTIWTGLANTNAIIAQAGHTNSAAQLCVDYTNDDYGTGVYSDWYLPSRGTLVEINSKLGQLNIPLVDNGGAPLSATGDASDRYWSSSEASTMNGWCRRFGNNTNYSNIKSTTFRVRCIRAF